MHHFYICICSLNNIAYLSMLVSASGSNQSVKQKFFSRFHGFSLHVTKWLPSADLHVFESYYHTLFQNCKLYGTSVASVSDFCILTMLVQIIGNWEVQHWGGMLYYNVYTKFHSLDDLFRNWIGGRGAEITSVFLAHHALYEPWADSITHLHVESFHIIILLHISAVEINDFVSWV